MTHHLAVLYTSYLRAVINGRKTVECRLGREGSPPHVGLEPGDLVWLKESGGPVRAVAVARSVRHFHELTPHLLELIRRQWGRQIGAAPAFWRAHRDAEVATLIWLSEVCSFEPFVVEKQDRRPWVLLNGPPIPGSALACD